MHYEIDLDATDHTILAVCPCGWRHFTVLRSDAWLRAAEHLKAEHNELYAAERARKAGVFAARSERKAALTSCYSGPPDTSSHGNPGHARTAGRRAKADRSA